MVRRKGRQSTGREGWKEEKSRWKEKEEEKDKWNIRKFEKNGKQGRKEEWRPNEIKDDGRKRERHGEKKRKKEREMVSSLCLHIHELHSSKFLAISWPSAGASKTLLLQPRRKTPGGRGEPEGRAVPHTHTHTHTHTLALFLTNTQFLSFHSLFLSFTHTRSLPSHTHISFLLSSHTQFLLSIFLFLLFYSLSHTHTHTLTCHPSRWGETPWCPQVRRRLHIPWSLAEGLQGSRPRSPKSHPSFPLISEKTSRKFPGKREREEIMGSQKSRATELTSVSVCVCVCVTKEQREKEEKEGVWEIKRIKGVWKDECMTHKDTKRPAVWAFRRLYPLNRVPWLRNDR